MSVQFDNIGDLKPKVTAGGKDNTKFVPNLNVSFFDDEFYFNLNRKDKIIKNEKAATASGKTSLGGIDTDIWYIDDKGRLKWDIEFTSRPAVNSWTWELKHAKGIEFCHQPALTAEEIADGCIRPDEVVGSYAVYCNKANNKYKTGKLCHIYRPFCYDAKGKTIYADLNIADGQMTITIDKKWLDSAVYPVRLDPTIGFSGTPGSSAGVSNTAYCTTGVSSGSLTAPSNGTCNTMYLYSASNLTYVISVAIYDNNGSPNYNLLLSKSVSKALTTGWNSITMDSTIDIISGNIYHVAMGVFNEGTRTISYDTTSGNACDRLSATSFPANWTDTTGARTYAPAVYLEYTESGGAGGLLVGQSALVGGGVLCGQGNLIN